MGGVSGTVRYGAPTVSVVMAVYNGERYLREAIDSILGQTFSDFEFVIIEDGSTDSAPRILEEYAARDIRVRIIRNPGNLGLTPSLNIGLRAARGRYIARMDGDDISLPERLERQVAFLETNPQVQLLGTGYVTIDATGQSLKQDVEAVSSWEYEWLSVIRTPVVHPSVMFRASLVREHGLFYDETLTTAQDFDLWVRILEFGTACALPDVLVYYRMHASNISSSRSESQRNNMKQIAMNHLFRRFPELRPHESDFQHFFSLMHGLERADVANTRAAIASMKALVALYIAKKDLSAKQRRFVEQTTCRWLMIAVFGRGGSNRPLVFFHFLYAAKRFLVYLPLEMAGFIHRRLVRRSSLKLATLPAK